MVIGCRRDEMDREENEQGDATVGMPLLSYTLREDTITSILNYSFGTDASRLTLTFGVEILLELVREPPQMDDDSPREAKDHERHQQGTLAAPFLPPASFLSPAGAGKAALANGHAID
jgi:hypothetical protein